MGVYVCVCVCGVCVYVCGVCVCGVCGVCVKGSEVEAVGSGCSGQHSKWR